MSYDIYLTDPITNAILETDVNHHIRGGRYAIGGSTRNHTNSMTRKRYKKCAHNWGMKSVTWIDVIEMLEKEGKRNEINSITVHFGE